MTHLISVQALSLLKPAYNRIKFKQYPKGMDGLYKSGYARYGYVLGEDISLVTSHGTFHGAWTDAPGLAGTVSSDLILVEADTVEVIARVALTR